MPSHVRAYDVVLVTDGRLPGGTAASVAEEIAAQHRAGYRTGLVHVDSHLVAGPRALNPRLARLVEDGAVDLLVGEVEAHARALVVRQPPVLLSAGPSLPRLTAEACLIVANQAPRDHDGGRVHYDVDEVDAAARTRWASTPDRASIWAPIGPLVRRQLQSTAPHVALLARDWTNVIDVDAWAVPRTGVVDRRPVVGRHGRDDARKWPATAADILAAYPADDDVEVRVLGGVEQALAHLRTLPDNWVAHPFGALSPQRFLAGIDVFVYFHHPTTVEAFGRTILEAMASGAVAVLPPHFRELFGDAPVYTEPAGVRRAVAQLAADPAAYLERSRRGQAHVREHYGHEAHLARLAELIGPPATTSAPSAAAATSPPGAVSTVTPAEAEAPTTSPAPADDRARVLFVSSNGAGVGHLMRLMAMARRAHTDVVPIFLTLSQAVEVVRKGGFYVEYLASRAASGLPVDDWHTLLRDRLGEVIATHGVRAVVFDGTWPYRGLFGVAADHPEVTFVWSRRAMWRRETESVMLPSAADFDLVLEPGELAETVDVGPTVARRAEAVRVGPVTYLDPAELLDRATARRELGLDDDRPAVLLQLGAGNINDLGSVVGAVAERFTQEGTWQVCVTRSAIAERAEDLATEVVVLAGVYPLARYLHAFDVAVTAAGYNTFHEVLAAGLPTIFLPNLATATDDQAARSRYAAEAGMALDVPRPSPGAIDAAVRTMLDPTVRERMAAEAHRRYPPGGAADAMRAVEQLLGLGPGPAPDRATGDLVAATAPDPALAPGADPSTDPDVAAPDTHLAVADGSTRDDDDRWRQVRGRLAAVARSPRLRSLARAPFEALPAPARDVIRTRVRRWEVAGWRIHEPSTHRLPVPAGSLLPAAETASPLPGVLYVLPADVGDAEAARLIERAAGWQVVHRGHAPIFATFSDDLAPVRRLGLVAEVLPTRQSWARVRPAEEWEAFVRARLRRLVETWDVVQVVALGEIAGVSREQLTSLSVRATAR